MRRKRGELRFGFARLFVLWDAALVDFFFAVDDELD
jgi:hypothetical protein